MRATAIACCFLLMGAAPVAALGQTSILPDTATLNPRGEPPEGLGRGRPHRPEATRPPHGRTCLNQSDTREAVAARRLVDPVRAFQLGRQQGDALSAKLCRWLPDDYVYEISVLRRDGRVLRLFMNAQSGEAESAPAATGQAAKGTAVPPPPYPSTRNR